MKKRRSVPRFDGLKSSSSHASRAKQRIGRRDTGPERQLRSALFRAGLRFRKNVLHLPGKPDVVFPRAQVAVFVDGDFWHGREWPARRRRLVKGSNSAYWTAKIRSNMRRDIAVARSLENEGWMVLRFWESEVKSDAPKVLSMIRDAVRSRIGRQVS